MFTTLPWPTCLFTAEGHVFLMRCLITVQHGDCSHLASMDGIASKVVFGMNLSEVGQPGKSLGHWLLASEGVSGAQSALWFHFWGHDVSVLVIELLL